MPAQHRLGRRRESLTTLTTQHPRRYLRARVENSKVDREQEEAEGAAEAKPKKFKAPASRRWVPPTFIAVGLLGVAWLIVYYIAGYPDPVHGRPRQLEHPDRHGRHGCRVRDRDSLAIAPRRSASPSQDGNNRVKSALQALAGRLQTGDVALGRGREVMRRALVWRSRP